MARGALYADLATPIESPRICDKVGSSAVQVVRTMPAPFEERGILDVWLRAIRAAKKLIYVEDQYFRSVLISEAIAATIQKNPQLGVIAITSEAHANQPLTGQWSRVCFDIIRAVRPDFELYALHVLGVDCRGNQCVLPVDNHGKGESFSPTDLVATALGTCMLTVMGIVAERHGWDLRGAHVSVEKSMVADPVRRIGKLAVVITFGSVRPTLRRVPTRP